VPVEIKFCGMTRPVDAKEAARLGARYVGAVFAGGPRRVDGARADECFRVLPAGVRRVGVFGSQSPDEIAAIAELVRLDVAQLHGDPDASAVELVRERTGLHVWGVARIDGADLPSDFTELVEAADAVVLDARVAGMLGGTGRTVNWAAVVERLTALRGRTPLVLAGGLTPENVRRAIDLLRPDVVDVSSGVETSPGIKDHGRMRAFSDAVRYAGANR